jgi:hypothetical protein
MASAQFWNNTGFGGWETVTVTAAPSDTQRSERESADSSGSF